MSTPIEFGTWVRDPRFGHIGRVSQMHDGCPESDDWFLMQSGLTLTDRLGPWASVLVHNGGSVAVPVRLLEVIEPIKDFDNRSIRNYWPAEARYRDGEWLVLKPAGDGSLRNLVSLAQVVGTDDGGSLTLRDVDGQVGSLLWTDRDRIMPLMMGWTIEVTLGAPLPR